MRILRILQQLLLTAFISLILCGCSNATEKKKIKPMATAKGVQQGMKIYYMGRFAIDVPAEFKLAVQSQKFRYAEVQEIVWPKDIPIATARKQVWDTRISEINKLTKPKGLDKVIKKNIDIDNVGKWCKAVLYYGNHMSNLDGYWDLLIDLGPVGIWIRLSGLVEYEKDMLNDIKEIATSYSYLNSDAISILPVSGGFYLEKGVINLPYLEQEKTYARFEGPMGMVLEMEMHEIHKAPEREGLIGRTVAAMATGFAAGIDIEKIRSRKRTAASLPGDEEILQGDDGKQKNVSFGWEYLGSVESGEKPMIQITVDTEADNLDEKIKIWDKVLDSFRPVYK